MKGIVNASYELARELHSKQIRRESGQPFFESHLVPVADLVRENDGDDVAISAALLHDAIEDIGPQTRDLIAAISLDVLSVVDQLTEKGETWDEEKQNYLTNVSHMDERALLVSICDKSCNTHDFIAEWKRGTFGRHPQKILWFFSELSSAYSERDYALRREHDYRGLIYDFMALVGHMDELYTNHEQSK